jgi:hypothetical protein
LDRVRADPPVDDSSKYARSRRSPDEIAKRKAEAERIRQKYSDRIPVGVGISRCTHVVRACFEAVG